MWGGWEWNYKHAPGCREEFERDIYSNEIISSCFRSHLPLPPTNPTLYLRPDDSDTSERMIMLSLRQTPLVAPSPAIAMAPATAAESSVSNANALQSRILEVRPHLHQVFLT